MLQWVWQRAVASGAATVLIATDDERIRGAALKFGADCVLTSPQHASGTDRIAEVVKKRGFAPDDIVVNLQGDEPTMPAEVVSGVAQSLSDVAGRDIATAVAPIESLEEFLDPNCVKALRAGDGRALYFSRAPVPCRATASARIGRRPLPARGGISASMPIGCANCCNLPHGRRRRSKPPKSSNSCVPWSTACIYTWWCLMRRRPPASTHPRILSASEKFCERLEGRAPPLTYPSRGAERHRSCATYRSGPRNHRDNGQDRDT